jgi:hypothetical protein
MIWRVGQFKPLELVDEIDSNYFQVRFDVGVVFVAHSVQLSMSFSSVQHISMCRCFGPELLRDAGALRDVAELGRGIPKRRLDLFISLEPPMHHTPFISFGFEYKQVRSILWQPRKMKFHHIGDFIRVAFLRPHPPLGDD